MVSLSENDERTVEDVLKDMGQSDLIFQLSSILQIIADSKGHERNYYIKLLKKICREFADRE